MTSIEDHVREEARRTLEAYSAQPNLVREHVGIEEEVLSGGYGHRQIHELIQNAADAILESGRPGRVHLVLTPDALYCANEGAPIDASGIDAILNSHMSRKRGGEIGQFGIGFKSVLAISTRPEFFCRSGSFAFHREWSEEQIRRVLPGVERTPVLRLAKPIPLSEGHVDQQVSALMQWATTVVKLPRNIDGTEWLSDDFFAFPREFLLFSPHVEELTLDDQVTGRVREVITTSEGNRVTILEGEEEAQWSVFAQNVGLQEIGTAALQDADRKTRDRSTLPVLWAVPSESRRARGRFWAFFPTETETSLTGILNAPWKTNADRQNLLDGAFNRALLGRVAELVAGSLPQLFRDSDPGYLLDLLPARASDAAGWADAALIAELEQKLASVKCIPDSGKALRWPGDLQMRPDEALSPAAVQSFSEFDETVLQHWVHPSVEKRERRAKAVRLGVEMAGVPKWLEALAAPPGPDASTRAILAAGLLEKEVPRSKVSELRMAKIILTSTEELVSASHRNLFLPHVDESLDPGELDVHPLVAANAEVCEVLRTLRVAEKSAAWHLNALLNASVVQWERVWLYLRQLSLAEALTMFEKHPNRHRLHVKTLMGEYTPLGATLLPGSVIPVGDQQDPGVCVDLESHREDTELLRAFGATSTPVSGVDEGSADWFREYLIAARSEFYSRIQKGASRPQWNYLVFRNTETAGPLDPLMALSDAGRVRMTRALTEFLPGDHPWILEHATRPQAYQPLECVPPIRWMLMRFGRVETSLGPRPIERAVAASLEKWGEILPVAMLNATQCAVLGLPARLGDMTPLQWNDAFDQLGRVADDRLVGGFYAAAAAVLPRAPELMSCRTGEAIAMRPPPEVYLACDADTAQAHRTAGIPSILVPDRDSVDLLVERWGMQRAAGTVRYIAASEEAPLTDAFPGLRRYVDELHWDIPLQPCETVWFEPAGGAAGAVTLRFARVGDRLCYRVDLDPVELLMAVGSDLGVPLSHDQVHDILEYTRREERQRVVEAVRRADTAADKLATLLDPVTLLAGLPADVQGVLAMRGHDRTPEHLAQAALAVYGVEVLAHYSGALASVGLDPPSRWNGGARAQEFADDLGFPPAYAGFPRPRRDPAFYVDGPVELKPLHEFQGTIGERIQHFLRKTVPERALLSLPTGSGKTRVVVQAFVESMKKREWDGVILWVAQSDELCEQAVQSWSQVWQALGPRHRLRISRLWGQTNNRVVEASPPHVVVATFQSLVSRLRSREYTWLRDAGCIIIDEAHGSIAPSYTEILENLGLTARDTARPLIGVTATPFRSAADPAETQWLVNRYGKQRFDHGVIAGDDPYRVLQDMGILARVEQRVLAGETLTLTETELAELVQFKRLPASAEFRLGESSPRNQRLIESIRSLPDDWPVLLFATSVEHAHLMAALLSLEGISSKAISGETDRGARRHYIEEFRQGRIRVLSNYNVLATGFDAPALRALYIARPVFSPVLYQQMIGRGLRGPMNGGKERCLVVNVQDNIAQFGEQLAFRHFEYLWEGGGI